MSKRKIIVTSGLPYANGDIHIGHMVEYLQTDFWVRFQKMRGHECYYFCGDDTHGTAIMISARKKNVSPEEFISEMLKNHIKDFNDFEIEFTNYSSTNIEQNRELSSKVFLQLEEQGHISAKEVEQTYCEHDKMFLPDRFVKGECPKCGASDQYGDSCDSCGSTYNPTELKNAACSICGNTPSRKSSEHLFFELNHFKDFLQKWVPQHNHPELAKKLAEWFETELRPWDISRDAPYFGFEIPGHPNKFFYVWVDAPLGYMAIAKEWCEKQGIDFDSFWGSDSTELYHFIGKDILYFHSLFWPAMLMGSNFKTPDGIFVHGMLGVNGEKMSKSKGTFINARTYLDHLSPTYLRYYFACKLNSSYNDLDLNLDDFVQRVNSDLIGKITNLASRGAQMLGKRIDSELSQKLSQESIDIITSAQTKADYIAELYEQREFSKVMVEIRNIADEANKYFDEKEPWKLLKIDVEATREVLTCTLNLFRILCIYLKPILPSYTQQAERIFNQSNWQWSDLNDLVTGIKISEYQHLAQRVDPKSVQKIVEISAELNASVKNEGKKDKMEKTVNEDGIISIDDFTKVDLRVAQILEANEVEGADKLLQLTLDVGEFGRKNVFAGIKSKYSPESLVNKKVILVHNLKARKMRFGLSEGMVLAAGGGDGGPFLIQPDDGAKPGQKVK